MMPQPGGETFNFLLLAGSTYYHGAAIVTSTGFSASITPITLPVPLPGFPPRALYGLGPSGAAYASYFTGSSWVCYLMTSSTSILLPGISSRIDAVLTSGDLLSTQDGTLRLYDSGGSLVSSMPLKGLQYCYETYVGPTPYVFFALPMALQHGNWVFNLYAIPTSSLRSLGG